MTNDRVLGTCDYTPAVGLHPDSGFCINWKPAPTPRVEIWRFNDNTLTVARSDGACWNGPDTMFANVRHEGVWNSELMRFVPANADCFTDGTPVALYEGLEPELEGYPV